MRVDRFYHREGHLAHPAGYVEGFLTGTFLHHRRNIDDRKEIIRTPLEAIIWIVLYSPFFFIMGGLGWFFTTITTSLMLVILGWIVMLLFWGTLAIMWFALGRFLVLSLLVGIGVMRWKK